MRKESILQEDIAILKIEYMRQELFQGVTDESTIIVSNFNILQSQVERSRQAENH